MRTTPTTPLAAGILLVVALVDPARARLADRSRVVKARGSGRRDKNGLAIEGGAYRGRTVSGGGGDDYDDGRVVRGAVPTTTTTRRTTERREEEDMTPAGGEDAGESRSTNEGLLRGPSSSEPGSSAEEWSEHDAIVGESPEAFSRRLSSQLTGCCYTYQSSSASSMCSLYGHNCQGGGGGDNHNSGDESCGQKGLSFIGVSFSVNTANGNPYSYQLCDQFPMENIIDRSYTYVMSMDEDGWLVGGGYKSFDYSGKMP
jgi:hypothetical protein